MQASLLEFPSRADMAITEGRFNKLETRISEAFERIVALESSPRESRRESWKSWLPIGAPVATLIVVIITVGIHLDNKISSLQVDMQKLTARTVKVEDAVKVLGDKQNNETKQIIHDLLAAARNGDPKTVTSAVQAASNLMILLRKEDRTADPQFFSSVLSGIQSLQESHPEPQVALASFKAQQQLAEYRSAQEWIAKKPGEKDPYEFAFELAEQFQGSHMGCSRNFKGESVWDIQNHEYKNPPNHLMENAVITNCPQILDGWNWVNVVFINSRIKYLGGPLILNHVQFIHCTFERVAPNDPGKELLRYAALDQTMMKVHPERLPLPEVSGL
jgi:hypothetical protein